MYIFEWLIKYLKNKPVIKHKSTAIKNYDDCEHFFMPIDSTGEMFSCKYCGLTLPKDKIENKNIFKPD